MNLIIKVYPIANFSLYQVFLKYFVTLIINKFQKQQFHLFIALQYNQLLKLSTFGGRSWWRKESTFYGLSVGLIVQWYDPELMFLNLKLIFKVF